MAHTVSIMITARVKFTVRGPPHDKRFELFWSTTKNRPVVRVIDENWDYEDCEWAAELSAEVRECRSIEAAAEMLGL